MASVGGNLGRRFMDWTPEQIQEALDSLSGIFQVLDASYTLLKVFFATFVFSLGWMMMGEAMNRMESAR